MNYIEDGMADSATDIDNAERLTGNGSAYGDGADVLQVDVIPDVVGVPEYPDGLPMQNAVYSDPDQPLPAELRKQRAIGIPNTQNSGCQIALVCGQPQVFLGGQFLDAIGRQRCAGIR